MSVSDVQDAAILRLRAELERTLARLEAQLRQDLADAPVDADGRPQLTDALGTEIVRQLGEEVATALEDIGSQATGGFRRLVVEVLAAVGEELADQGVPEQVTAASETALNAQLGNTVDKIAVLAGDGQADLREVLTEMARSSLTPAAAIDRLVGVVGRTAALVMNTVDTAAMAVDRAVVLAQASDAGARDFALDGPVDSLTRAWCREHVGYRYTEEQIAALVNDVGPQPPALYCGGYRCRHRWLALMTAEQIAQWRPWPGGP